MNIDIPLLSAILTLFGISLVLIYSSSGQDIAMVKRQGTRIIFSLLIMLIASQVSPAKLRRYSGPIFIIAIVLLILTLFFGEISKGSQRWLQIGFARIQTSELMKLALPLMIAYYISKYSFPTKLYNIAISFIIILIPTTLISMQPDLGTSILVASAGFFVLFLAGMNWKIIAALLAGIGAFLPILWYFLMHDYQRRRVLTFLNPESNPLGAGYHIIQSKIAIGSGGLYGKGWLNGTQSQLEFLPERHTDFIFAVFCEEFGLIGVSILLSIYLFIIARGLYIAVCAQDPFSKILGGSLTLTFFVYLFVNIGMVSGLLPVVGVPLPLISYGGASMSTILAGFGILMSIHSHTKNRLLR